MSTQTELDSHASPIAEMLRRLERRIHRRLCRHSWRLGRSTFGHMVCIHCGKMSVD
jgi:hypothetical protein